MSLRVSTAAEASRHLCKVENLLDRTLADLTGSGPSAPHSACPAILAEAIREMQSFATSLQGSPSEGRSQIALSQQDIAALTPRLKELLWGIAHVERLLFAAAEFYRGWCAAGLAPVSQAPGYQICGWSDGPALLALKG